MGAIIMFVKLTKDTKGPVTFNINHIISYEPWYTGAERKITGCALFTPTGTVKVLESYEQLEKLVQEALDKYIYD